MKIHLFCLALLAAAPAALAQNVVTVLEGKTPQVVRAVVLGNSMIMVKDKLVTSNGTLYALRQVPAYRKGFIKFSELTVKETRLDDPTGGTIVFYGEDVDAYLQSDTPLKRCFIVLEVISDSGKGLYMSELPDLEAGAQQKIRVSARLQEHLDDKHYTLHVFSDGQELLNSTMSADYIAEQTKKTDEFILKSRPDSPVRMARGIAPAVPVYPAKLMAQGLAGSAKVSCTIDAQGNLATVDVLEATDPLFGESLAAAARQWKFEPAVKDHQFVQAVVVVPYDFKPAAPATAATK